MSHQKKKKSLDFPPNYEKKEEKRKGEKEEKRKGKMEAGKKF